MPPKEAHEKYKKMDILEHVYERPGMYIGSVEPTQLETYYFNDETKKMEQKTATLVPGLLKVINEATTNALDHVIRMKKEIAAKKEDAKPVTYIKIRADKATGFIEVENNGDAPDAIRHPDYNDIWIPEMLFGNMHTSTNYDKNEDRIGAGVNGLGVTVLNVMCKEFYIDLVDHHHKKSYTQRFMDNLKKKDAPVVKTSAKAPYTRVRFLPDYPRFGLKNGMTDDIFEAIRKMAFDVAACTDDKVAVSFNDEKVEVKDFAKYTDLFLGTKDENPRVHEKCNDKWEVIAAVAPRDKFEQVSFVNGNATTLGGKHVEDIVNQITKEMVDMVKSKKKVDVKPQFIKDNLMVFIKCTIPNPEFNSQTKEYLSTPVSKFGSKCKLSEAFMKALFKTGIADKAVQMSAVQQEKAVAKTDGKKTTRVFVPKLQDANDAGGKKSAECTLILTEGDSAATMAIAGLSVVGRDKYGVFPLRGKMLNVRDCSLSKIADNEEISNLKKALGLKHGVEYKDASELRYGHIMVMTDADHDGSHIKGLLFNMFQSLYPSLYRMPGFLTSMLTPIVKVKHTNGQEMEFFNLTDFEKWKDVLEHTPRGMTGWKIFYKKGLGSSSEAEAKQYFRDMRKMQYDYTGKQSDEALDLAFNKKRADNRKEWLMKYDRDVVLDANKTNVPYEEFINKELIHFSNRDLERSIPSICDGFKESLRKVMFGCLKRKLYNDPIKVAQLAAYIAEVSAYHHGETSLQEAITGMAQIYVGTNNINLLEPKGQFGSRVAGGKDAASPRYIFTNLSPLARTIFREEDSAILKYLDDDGLAIEPMWYISTIPMILCNGTIAIATGFSSTVPAHNPSDIISWCERINAVLPDIQTKEDVRAACEAIKAVRLGEIKPWYLGFTGTIEKSDKEGGYISRGTYNWVSDTVVEITELPIGTWSADYQEFLLGMVMNGSAYLKDFETHYTSKTVRFVLKLHAGVRNSIEDSFETVFKLTSSKGLSTNNIHLFNAKGAIQKYKNAAEVMKDWACVRVEKYLERKNHMLREMERDFKLISAKVKFINDVITGKIVVSNRPIGDVVAQLRTHKYPMFKGEKDLVENPELVADDEGGAGGYGYLVRMHISSLTMEKKKQLEKEASDLNMSIEALRAKSIQSLWKDDLDQFRAAWEAHRQQVEDDYEADRSGTGAKPSSGTGRKKTATDPKKDDGTAKPKAAEKKPKAVAKAKAAEPKKKVVAKKKE